MKVLKMGKVPESKPLQALCSNCSSFLEFSSDEAQHIIDKTHGDRYEVKCLICAHTVTKVIN